jgi:hypothetical protein
VSIIERAAKRKVTGRAAAAVAMGLAAATSAPVSGLADTLGVVELFTSQGCSSCPPADRVLADIARDPRIVALSFSVDYWDYLGWRDTFAKPEFTKRQRSYAEARGDRTVYTPQVVVNGRDHLIGSDHAGINASLAAFKAAGHGMSIDVTARVEGDRIIVRVPPGRIPDGSKAAVWIASFRGPESVEIENGENAGKAVTYANVVDRWQVLGMWDGDEMTVELPISDIAGDHSVGCAVVLQTKKNGVPGPILGAAKVALEIN